MSNNPISGFGDTFLSKLKEQSFTIIILVAIMWYQNNLFTTQMKEYRQLIDEKEKLVLKLTEEERQRLVEREKYLMNQRDEFLEDLKKRAEK
jgi:hypothetical protein